MTNISGVKLSVTSSTFRVFAKILLLLTIFSFHGALAKNILREVANHHERPDFIRGSRAHSERIHQITIGIQQRNLDIIEKKLYEVSDMASPKYGQHLSFEEVGNLIANPEATEAVTSWLQENRVNIVHTSTYGEYIVAQASISTLEKMFEAEFYEFSDSATRKQMRGYSASGESVVSSLSYSLPESLDRHVSAVHHISTLPTPMYSSLKASEMNKASAESVKSNDMSTLTTTAAITADPSFMKSEYKIYGDGSGFGNQTCYATGTDTFLPSDLSLFQQTFGLPQKSVDRMFGLQIPSSSNCQGTNALANCGASSLDLQHLMATASNVSTTFWYDVGNDYDFLNFAVNVSSFAYPSLVFTITYGTYENFLTSAQVSAFNTEAMKLGVRGVTLVVSSGDDGVTGWLYRQYPSSYPISKCGYFSMWPAASPYVTTVGGTRFSSATSEIVDSSDAGGYITSGGGFSFMNKAPSFQSAAISSYFSHDTPRQTKTQRYSSTNRGYPDLSLLAESFPIFVDGVLHYVSSTSASASVFAGMVALVNAQRLASGSSSLGWLNPSIYANYGGFVNADITSGNNYCTADSTICCTIGFKATPGWDPVTGFGSVNFAKFATFYSTLKPTSEPTSWFSTKPTTAPSIPPTSEPTNEALKPDPTSPPVTHPPSSEPSYLSSSFPTHEDTSSPSSEPFSSPTESPSAIITSAPSAIVTSSPSAIVTIPPSAISSDSPTASPSTVPSSDPSSLPTPLPTAESSHNPSSQPSSEHTVPPSAAPTSISSASPTAKPSAILSAIPTSKPSRVPTAKPSASPSSDRTRCPTAIPTVSPSATPSTVPTDRASQTPTAISTTSNPSFIPTPKPSSAPTIEKSSSPSSHPTSQRTLSPTATRTAPPTRYPTSAKPTSFPSERPSSKPTVGPSPRPSSESSCKPTAFPSSKSSSKPTGHPTSKPTLRPSASPSTRPTADATSNPTRAPSGTITAKPTAFPTAVTSSKPTAFPTAKPTAFPSVNTARPSAGSTAKPTRKP